MNLTKSLEELDAIADELLAKSKAAEDEEPEEDITPEEIADDSTSTPESDEEDVEEETEEDETEEDVKKSEDVEDKDIEESEEEEPNGDNLEKSEEPEPEEVEKSFKAEFESNDVINSTVDGNEFFAAMVDVFSKSLGDMQFDVQHQTRQQNAAFEVMAKSMQAAIRANDDLKAENEKLTRRITKLEKSITSGFEQIMDSLEEISSQPVGMRKSMASINVQDRDFTQSINGQKASVGFESLTKSQVLDALNAELYSGNSNVTPTDIISYESGAPLRNDLQTLVANKYK